MGVTRRITKRIVGSEEENEGAYAAPFSSASASKNFCSGFGSVPTITRAKRGERGGLHREAHGRQ
jgi:hypothetical protein